MIKELDLHAASFMTSHAIYASIQIHAVYTKGN